MLSRFTHVAFFLSQVLILSHGQIDPQHARKLTVYHVHPKTVASLPVNADTGDIAGDLTFYLAKFLLPLQCVDPVGKEQFDCNNPELHNTNLVVTQVSLEVDDRFTAYSGCNLCNGTDPVTRKPCAKGAYICDCFGNRSCDRRKVGRKDVTQQDFYPCNSSSPIWDCWRANLFRKTGGVWYSLLEDALCHESSESGTCSWSPFSILDIKETCLQQSVTRSVEAAGRECFGTCGIRNQTSPCWIGCFFSTVMGPKAGVPNETLTGMPLSDLVRSWQNAFRPKTEGGCAEGSNDFEV